MRTFYRFLASCCFISYAPAAILKNKKFTGAGFLGTAFSIPFIFLLPENPVYYAVFLIIFFFFAVFISAKANYEVADDTRIVIDEMAGFFVTMFMLPRVWWVILTAFVLFRVSDTVKPFYIKKLDNIKNAWGVVLDDVASGVLVCVIMHIVVRLSS